MPQLVADSKIAAHELGTVEGLLPGGRQHAIGGKHRGKDGPTYVSSTGEIKRHPATTLVKEAVESSRRLATKLGLTPARHTKNKGGAVGSDEDDALGDT
ncbi:P27 family phage terminase small subunit [Rhizobium sp. XQZ8]|uniref:P27 family phage terminase small subunit n=1 Tax=Rhizobium populisoli TaxID=2859785 RepID=UPI001CA4F522|nr:P27 family phage terminase small subunit [Rhizobium populisoli]